MGSFPSSPVGQKVWLEGRGALEAQVSDVFPLLNVQAITCDQLRLNVGFVITEFRILINNAMKNPQPLEYFYNESLKADRENLTDLSAAIGVGVVRLVAENMAAILGVLSEDLDKALPGQVSHMDELEWMRGRIQTKRYVNLRARNMDALEKIYSIATLARKFPRIGQATLENVPFHARALLDHGRYFNVLLTRPDAPTTPKEWRCTFIQRSAIWLSLSEMVYTQIEQLEPKAEWNDPEHESDYDDQIEGEPNCK